MAWGWDKIEQSLEDYGGFLYDLNQKASEIKQTIKDKTDEKIKDTTLYKNIESELSSIEQNLENMGAKLYDVKEKATDMLATVGEKTQTTSKYFFWGVVGIVGLVIYSKLK